MEEQLRAKQKEIAMLTKTNEKSASEMIVKNASKKIALFLSSVITQDQ